MSGLSELERGVCDAIAAGEGELVELLRSLIGFETLARLDICLDGDLLVNTVTEEESTGATSITSPTAPTRPVGARA